MRVWIWRCEHAGFVQRLFRFMYKKHSFLHASYIYMYMNDAPQTAFITFIIIIN